MVRGVAAGLALLLGACASTPASGPLSFAAAPGGLITRYDEAALKKVVADLGYSLVDTDVSSTGKPFMSVEAGDEVAFRIMGESCVGEGKEQVCQGIQLSTQFGETAADLDVIIEQGNRTLRPAKLFRVDSGMAYERYLIMDGGITAENLSTNISVFVEVLQIVLERL
jgi:hypothetical protein